MPKGLLLFLLLVLVGTAQQGRKDRAVIALNHAIDQLSIVERNDEIQDAIRASARKIAAGCPGGAGCCFEELSRYVGEWMA